MPLFNRPDGTLIKGEPRIRRMMPYLMRGRNESIILHRTVYDLSRTTAWLEAYNRTHTTHATLFHLFLYACAHALHERPGLNRFVAGGHLYQREDVTISFVAKQAFADDAPFVTVKLTFPRDESFSDLAERIVSAVANARKSTTGAVHTELKVALALPGVILRGVMAALRSIDRLNLLPAEMIDTDPMYASLFVANLGSVGVDDTFHHLYEYGTVSLFGVMGSIEKSVFVTPKGAVEVRDGMRVCWSLDERINDGFFCASALAIAKKILEDPARYVDQTQKRSGLDQAQAPEPQPFTASV